VDKDILVQYFCNKELAHANAKKKNKMNRQHDKFGWAENVFGQLPSMLPEDFFLRYVPLFLKTRKFLW